MNRSGPAVDRHLVDDLTELVVEAGRLTLRWFEQPDLAIERKGDGSPVTEADREAEDFLRNELSRRFPDDAIVGEELGSTSGRSGRTWIIDPIDGTESFIRGVPLYTNLLALVDQHGPAVGVANVPALEEVVGAGRGIGCHASDGAAAVSHTSRLEQACVSSSAYETSWWPVDALASIAGSGARLRTWGDGYGYILLATGRIDAMVEPPIRLWDVAPMQVIVPEAGGTLTTWSGDPWPTGADTASVLATNGELHEPLLELLRTT